jgi:hypothetical protein
MAQEQDVAHRVPVDPDKGINDLVAQLAGDSKRLLADEVRLAKLETSESIARAGRGALWLGLAFGILVVMLVAATIFLTTLIGRMANGHHWLGALLTGALELGLGFWLVRRGMRDFKRAPYSMPETRASLTLARD